MIDNKRIFQVDAFTEEPFKGNPAGVMIIDENISSDWMQNVAMEMNLSETAFLIPHKKGFKIRYFTPTREVSLCGHATLASAHIIYELALKSKHETIELKAKGVDLTITKENDWIIAVAENESDIANSKPNFELMEKKGLGHLMITAKSDFQRTDFVVRCFAPASGINEDPVTGSAHCALTPLWAEKLGKNELDSLQLSKRTGKLKVKLDNDRVEIKGKALTIFEAKMKI